MNFNDIPVADWAASIARELRIYDLGDLNHRRDRAIDRMQYLALYAPSEGKANAQRKINLLRYLENTDIRTWLPEVIKELLCTLYPVGTAFEKYRLDAIRALKDLDVYLQEDLGILSQEIEVL